MRLLRIQDRSRKLVLRKDGLVRAIQVKNYTVTINADEIQKVKLVDFITLIEASKKAEPVTGVKRQDEVPIDANCIRDKYVAERVARREDNNKRTKCLIRR